MRFISVIAQTSHITACRHGKKRTALGRDMQMVQLSLTSSAASSLAEGATSAPSCAASYSGYGGVCLLLAESAQGACRAVLASCVNISSPSTWTVLSSTAGVVAEQAGRAADIVQMEMHGAARSPQAGL